MIWVHLDRVLKNATSLASYVLVRGMTQEVSKSRGTYSATLATYNTCDQLQL